MNNKFIIIDGTDSVCFGGFGNLKGNLGLLKYSDEEVKEKLIEDNTKEDDIRLVNSLLGSIRELKQIIDEANKIVEECLLIGTYEYEIEEQLDNLKRVLGGKQ